MPIFLVYIAVALMLISALESCSFNINLPPSASLGGSAPAPGSEDPPGSDDCGAPVWYVDTNNQNLIVRDTPLWLNTPYGEPIQFTMTYNLLAETETHYASGIRWSNSFHEYVTYDSEEDQFYHYAGNNRIDIYNKVAGTEQYQINSGYLMDGEKAGMPAFAIHGESIQLDYPNGWQVIFSKIADNRYVMTAETDPYTNTTQYQYQDGLLRTVTSADKQVFTLTYNADNLLNRVTDPTGRSTVLEYDAGKHLKAITDMQGYRASFTYDSRDYLTSITDAIGTTQFIVEIGNPDEKRIATYPAYGEPLELSSRLTIIDPQQNKSEYFYNSAKNELWYVSPEHYIEYQSDNINNSLSRVPKKRYTYYSYADGYSRVKKVTFADKSWISYSYDDNRHLSSISNSLGETYSYLNSEYGLLTEYTDKSGNTTTYSYDDKNNLIQITNVFGTETFTYNNQNSLSSYTDVKGHTSEYHYNPQGQLISATNPQQQVVQLSYGADDYLSSVTMAGKTLAELQYDAAGRLLSETGLHGRTVNYRYDNISQLTKIVAPGGRETTITQGSCPKMPVSETLPGERTYRYRYDANKNLTQVTDPMQGQTQLVYNQNNWLTKLIDANQNETTFTYNNAGRLTSKTYADGSSVQLDYSTQGQLRTRTNARGIKKTYQYDAQNRLISVSYSDTTPGVSYQYDTLGRLSQITDGAGTTVYQYAATGELEAIDGPLTNDTISFSYDELYQVSAISVNGAVNSQYSYDELGRITHINALGKLFTYQFLDNDSNPGYIQTAPNGITQTALLDSQGDIDTIRYTKGSTSLAQFGYTLDVAGNIIGLDSSEPLIPEPEPFSATYNALNQISSFNGQSGEFVYDAEGNLTAGLLPGNIPFSASYDAENRLTEIQFSKSGQAIIERFTYNAQHMMTHYERTEAGVVAASKQFVRLGLVELEERDAKGTITAQNAWHLYAPGGVGGLLIRKSGTEQYSYLTNHLGHVYGVFDSAGNRLTSHRYSPYGAVSGNDFTLQPFGMSTKRSDFASGLVYFGYRFYMPNLGRWLNRDPLQENGGINLYAYVKGDPLGYVDPDGRIGWGGAFYGAISGAIGGYTSGGLEGAFWGTLTGAVIGIVNPFSSYAAGAAAGGSTANLLGQLLGNLYDGKDPTDPCNYDPWQVLGAGIGGAVGGPANNVLRYYFPIYPTVVGRPLYSGGVNRIRGQLVGAAVEGVSVGLGEKISGQ